MSAATKTPRKRATAGNASRAAQAARPAADRTPAAEEPPLAAGRARQRAHRGRRPQAGRAARRAPAACAVPVGQGRAPGAGDAARRGAAHRRRRPRPRRAGRGGAGARRRRPRLGGRRPTRAVGQRAGLEPREAARRRRLRAHRAHLRQGRGRHRARAPGREADDRAGASRRRRRRGAGTTHVGRAPVRPRPADAAGRRRGDAGPAEVAAPLDGAARHGDARARRRPRPGADDRPRAARADRLDGHRAHPAGAGAADAARRPAAGRRPPRLGADLGPHGTSGPAAHRPRLPGARAGQHDLRRVLLVALDGEHPRGQGLHLRPAQPRRPARARRGRSPSTSRWPPRSPRRRCSRPCTSWAASRRCRSRTPRSSRCASTRSARWRWRTSTQAGLASTLSGLAAFGLGLDWIRQHTAAAARADRRRRERGRGGVLRARPGSPPCSSATPRPSASRSPRWSRSRADGAGRRPRRRAARRPAAGAGHAGTAPGLRRDDTEWLAAPWDTARVLLVSPRSETPVGADGGLDLRPATDAPRRSAPAARRRRRRRRTSRSPPTPTPTARWRTLRDIGATIERPAGGPASPPPSGSSSGTSGTPHCPRCGAADRRDAGRAGRAPARRRQRALPAHRPGRDHARPRRRATSRCSGRGPQWGEGRFSTLAGFVEPGETLEGAVAREVFEEVGVDDPRHPLRRQPAVAVPGLAHARLHRAARRRSVAHPRPGRDGRGRLVQPRRDAPRRRLDRRRGRRTATRPARGCGRSRRCSRSRAS